ncbi:hypothetical protein OC842_003497 [Tilletia horrida]|uniref:Uncharacterized protein n=1 Tax=Tilletia horrida TaxID=155126 RepID=A0AAN6GG08_9BASI|nr:hypothetical protein OC842_003497 [Tilletia horrida]
MASAIPHINASDAPGGPGSMAQSELDIEDEEFMDFISSHVDDSELDASDDEDQLELDSNSDASDDGERGSQLESSAAVRRRASAIIKEYTMADCDATEDELEAGRPVARWNDTIKASAKLVDAFNGVADVCSSASDSVRVGVELVRLIAETAASSLKTYKRDLDALCVTLLHFYHRVATFQTLRGYERNEPATHAAPFLQNIQINLGNLCDDIIALAPVSMVQRSVQHRAIREKTDYVRDSVVKAMVSFRSLLKAPAMPYDIARGKPSSALSSESQMQLCYGVVSDELYILGEPEDLEPDVQQQLALQSLLRGCCPASTLSAPNDPASEKKWRRDGPGLALTLGQGHWRRPPAQTKAAMTWLNRVVAFDATPAQLEFDTREQVWEANRHAITTMEIFDHVNEEREDWALPRGSTDLQALILAMCHLGCSGTTTFAELAALHLRDEFERHPSSDTQIRLVNALGVLGFAQLCCKEPTDAYHSAEAGIRLLKSLDEQQPDKHTTLMARLSLISAQALDRFHRPKLRAIVKRKAIEAARLFEAALEADEDDFDAKVGLAQALKMDGVGESKKARLRIVEVYRDLASARPLLFEKELADAITRLSEQLDIEDPATGELIYEAVKIYKRQGTLAIMQTQQHQACETYQRTSELRAAAGDVHGAINSLKIAIRLSEGGPYIDCFLGDYHCEISLLHLRIEEYKEAIRAIGQARAHWTEHGRAVHGTQSKEEYVSALALFMADKPLLAADKLRLSLRAMRKKMKSKLYPGIYDVKDDPEYALAMGDLGAVEAAMGQSELALRHGLQALRLGLRHLKPESKDTTTRRKLSFKACDEEVKIHVARLRLLYGATLLHVGRVEEAREQLEKCFGRLYGTPIGLERWGGPVLKTAYGCYERILREQGHVHDAERAKAAGERIGYRGFFNCLAPFRDGAS